MTACEEFERLLDEYPNALRRDGILRQTKLAPPIREALIALYNAAHPAKAEAGWVMVPREPTKEMLEAMRYTSSVKEMWADALAAAPPAPGAEKV